MVQTLFEREEKPRNGRLSILRPPPVEGNTATLLRQSPHGVFLSDFARSTVNWGWACDEALCITHLTEGFTAMTGYPVRQYIGAPLEQLLDFSGPQDAARFMAQLSQGQSVDGEMAVVKAQDAPIAVRFSAIPLRTEDGELMGHEGGVVELAERPNGSVAEVDTDSQLQMAHKVQHELRTPLNAIAGFAQIMREDLKNQADGRYAGYCDDILSASNHLLGLIDDMVSAYGTVEPRAGLVPVESDLGTVIREVDRLLSPVAEKAGVDLIMNPRDIAAACLTDRRKLKQIILNLLENAVKFTPSGARAGVDIELSSEHFVDVVVWDEGPGIAPEDQERIWQRFEKAGPESAYEASSPGLGLGLSVVKALADGIGAQLSLQSAQGQGSRFTIRLPAAH